MLLFSKVHTLFRFLLLYLFLIQDPKTMCHMTCGPHVSLVSSGLWQSLRLVLFWWPWQYWGDLVRHLVESSAFRFMAFSSWLDWSAFSSLYIKGMCSGGHLSLPLLTLVTWLRQWWSHFPTMSSSFPCAYSVSSWAGRHYVEATRWERELVLPLDG